ncbi:uncharacterized protein PAC_14669 [Phialocephala subalpina]|uniref:Uncharacterized protein n=1 Tax=Phialocephala subalpina TaxID=576137 RepID=A0A1L7XIA7_9HELO|nr:uncharacterized protein PAC_14669 [Phialocephala subalpina]
MPVARPSLLVISNAAVLRMNPNTYFVAQDAAIEQAIGRTSHIEESLARNVDPDVVPTLRNWKMYIIFTTFNGAAFIHIFLTAPETKGKTLEEMDEVFDSRLPAWHTVPKGNRLDQLQKDIEARNIKIAHPIGGSVPAPRESEKTPVAAEETAPV